MDHTRIADLILSAEVDNVDTEFNFGSSTVKKGAKRRKHIRARADVRIGDSVVRVCSDTPDVTLMKRLMPLVGIQFDRLMDVHTDIRCAAAMKVEEIRTVFNDSILESPIPAESMVLSMREKKRMEEEKRKREEWRRATVSMMVSEIRQNQFSKEEVLEMWREAVVTDVIES